MVSNYIIAKLQISEDMSLMAMINNNTIHFFDNNGNDVQRDILSLPDVFVLNFIDGENRAFHLVKEKEYITQGNLYVINRDNKVIFTSANKEAYNVYTRITSNSIMLGINEKETDSQILIPTKSSGRLIDNNQLTDKRLIGIRNNYYLFSEESEYSNEYHLYVLLPKFYDADESNLDFVQKFQADFILLWRSKNLLSVIYYNRNSKNAINVKSYDASGYYCWDSPKLQTFNIDVDLTNVNWNTDVQILFDDDSIILHHIKASTDYKGFTIVIEQIKYDKFRLCNQKKIGKYNNETIELYANSLILLNNPSGFFIHNRNGNVIAETEKDYDYQKQRASITDYAIIDRRLSEPWIKSPIQNNYARYGVISTETLEMIVPTNFNTIDFIVLEAPSTKHYRIKGEYEIYIKVCIETVDKHEKSIENWGLFKHSEYLLPCFFKSINIIRCNNNFIFVLENHEGSKGILYKDRIITQCIYEGITELGCYLLMNRPDGLIDVLYIDKEQINLYEKFSSVTSISLKLNFLREKYTNSEVVIVAKNEKYGLICKGQLIAECLFDEICAINADPNCHILGSELSTNPLWFMLRKENKRGIFSTRGSMTEIVYDDVNVLDWKTCNSNRNYGSRYFIVKLDEKFYTAENNTLICNNSDLTFRGFISSDIIVFSNNDSSCLELYTCSGEKYEFVAFDNEGCRIDTDDFEDTDDFYSNCEYAVPNRKWCSVELTEEEFVYSFSENEIVRNPFFHNCEDEDDTDSNYSDNDYIDDYDYERETFYALGGDDYDEWRNNGGNLDDMMDGMGY